MCMSMEERKSFFFVDGMTDHLITYKANGKRGKRDYSSRNKRKEIGL